MPHLIGVFREPEFSPGRVEDDAAILERTRDALAANGWTLTLGNHELLAREPADAVLAMCQSATALATLDRLTATTPIINTPAAIRACYRRETIRRLAGTKVPFPASRVIASDEADSTTAAAAPCWVKRGDVHAMSPADVVFAATPAAICRALRDFADRGVARVVVQAHVPGVVVKFYGVADGRFFRCYTDGAEVPAPISRLWEATRAGAGALGLEVFGGDLVVTADGSPVLVDLNDWPSFSRCRDEAADAIAAYVVNRLRAVSPGARRPTHGSEARI